MCTVYCLCVNVYCVLFVCKCVLCTVYCLCVNVYCVLFVCKCVLYCCHRVGTQFRLTNISIISVWKCVIGGGDPLSFCIGSTNIVPNIPELCSHMKKRNKDRNNTNNKKVMMATSRTIKAKYCWWLMWTTLTLRTWLDSGISSLALLSIHTDPLNNASLYHCVI